jgi:hypothetical protein
VKRRTYLRKEPTLWDGGPNSADQENGNHISMNYLPRKVTLWGEGSSLLVENANATADVPVWSTPSYPANFVYNTHATRARAIRSEPWV